MTTESIINEIACYYFGCWREPGHFLWTREMRRVGYTRVVTRTPWGVSVDGWLTPKKCAARQGEAQLHHRDGWTALAFHDYSVDRRPGSNSAFLFSEILDFEHALLAAAANFPEIVARVGPIREVERLDRAEGRQ